MNLDKPKTGTLDDKKTAARKRLASDCQTTVICDVRIRKERAASLSELIKASGRDGRFDLLTVPDPAVLATDAGRELLEQLVGETLMALDFHNGEQVLIAMDGDPDPVVRAFRAQFAKAVKTYPKPISEAIPIGTVPAAAPAALSSAVAVTCMDFRLHDDGISEKLRDGLGLQADPMIYAMAGGAKDIDGTTRRSRLALEEIDRYARTANLRQIALTCHTDCGAFGGDGAFKDRRHQKNELRYRLRNAASVLAKRFPGLEIKAGIVRLKRGGIDAILPVTLE